MGNICCQTDTTDDPFTSIMPNFKDYKEVQWLEGDEKMQKWKADLLKSKVPIEGEQEKQFVLPTLLKHNEEDRYYIGEWNADGHPSGIGQIYEPNRLFFDGRFQNGFPEGKGILQNLATNCQYSGQFKEGRANGTGLYNDMKRCYTINGQWDHSRPISGVLTLRNDKNMINVKFDDFSSRKGVITYRDFRVYTGEIDWNKVLPNGYGVVEFPETEKKKAKYEGQWLLGEMHGKGKFQWRDGSCYEGEYIHGKKQGFGKFIFASSKSCYEGSWANGKQDGAGINFNSEGEEDRRGLFENGRFVKPLTPEQFDEQKQKDYNRHAKIIQQQKQEHKIQQDDEKQMQKIEQKQNQAEEIQPESHVKSGRPSTIKEEEKESSYVQSGMKNSSQIKNAQQPNQPNLSPEVKEHRPDQSQKDKSDIKE